MKEVAVIGGGAAGLMAAYAASCKGHHVTIYEKNEKCGKKIYITGKGRCNVTNDCEPNEFFSNVVNNSKFLTGAIYNFPPARLMELLEENGCSLKIERGNRVFPVSDHASDITKTLLNLCHNNGVSIQYLAKVEKIIENQGTISGIIVNNKTISCDIVIVCTGGVSYPSTGSDGDGYKFASLVGHKVVEAKPALCALNLKGDFYKKLQGLTLKNVRLIAECNSKIVSNFFGELLFTHFGISGPIVLSTSSLINRLPLQQIQLKLDLKPALTFEQLDERLLRDFDKYKNKSIANCLKELLPSAFIDVILLKAQIDGNKKVNVIKKTERAALEDAIKNFTMQVASLRDFSEAIITSGGVDVKQINPKNMESKLIKGLHFCGEVLNVDAFTGGFNLQIAFATGYAAGSNVEE